MYDYFNVTSSAGDYSVQIRYGLPNSLYADEEGGVVICDKFIASNYKAVSNRVIAIEASENAKSLDQMGHVIVQLREFNVNRSTLLVAIGGGVIQDIATFVSSIYMRGLVWHYFPTTLLGMVDSCIGGKSSINVGDYKNLVGNFYPPQKVVIDLKFIDTLGTEQRAAGLFEAVKICFAHTGEAFRQYLLLNPGPVSEPTVFERAVTLSLLTKRWFIEIDEHDKNERLLLNFGHTFGHAIEGSCNFAIPHGVAVGLGMLAALEFAQCYGQFAKLPPRAVELQRYLASLMGTLNNLSSWRQAIVLGDLIKRFEVDKKHSNTHYAVIIPNSEGHLVRLMVEKTDANRHMLFKAFKAVCVSPTA